MTRFDALTPPSSDPMSRRHLPTVPPRPTPSAATAPPATACATARRCAQSIRENIADIIAEESIIGKDRDRIIKVPIRGIKEYRFVYGDNAPGVGQGDGDTQPGQVVGQARRRGRRAAGRAGDKPGVDYYETDVTPRGADRHHVRGSRAAGPRAQGAARDRRPSASPSARATARSASACASTSAARSAPTRAAHAVRHAAQTSEHRPPTTGTALPVPQRRPDLPPPRHRRARGVQRRRPLHHGHLGLDGHDEEVPGAQLLLPALPVHPHQVPQRRDRLRRPSHRGARRSPRRSSSTRASPAARSSRPATRRRSRSSSERYHPSLWNVYAFHCSDGDNFDSDNAGGAARRARSCAEVCNLFGYGEIKPLGLALLRELDAEHLPPPRRRQLPDRADRAQGRHLAELQGASSPRTAAPSRATA